MLLALDTSTHQASIALVRNNELLAELTWEVGRRHSQELLDRINWLCSSAGVHPSDLTTVAVALGPGSFNGIRVAVTTAKLLAFSLAIPVYGCSTLDVIAYGHASANGTLVAVLDAGRGEVYAAEYHAGASLPDAVDQSAVVPVAAGLWRSGDFRVLSPQALADSIAGAFLLCGDCRAETQATLEVAAGSRMRVAPDPGGRRASWLAPLAAQRLAHGTPDSAAALEPLYVHRPAITVSARHVLPGDTPMAPDVRSMASGKEGNVDALRH